MQRHLLPIAKGATVLAFGAMFAIGAHFASQQLVASQREKNFEELNDAVLRRTEASIDASASILAEILAAALDDCGDGALQGTRLRVYQTNIIKDIRILDDTGAVRCSAYSETLEFDKTWPLKDDMIAAVDGRVRLFRAERFSSDALGVFVEGAKARSPVAAIVGVDASQLDVLPEEIGSASRVSVALDDGQTIASFGSLSGTASEPLAFVRHSKRYPVSAKVEIDGDAIGGTDSFLSMLITTIGGALGLLFGALMAWAATRPPHPLVAIDEGIRAGEFKPYFQPIFSLDARDIVGCEILMRWERANGHVMSPAAFMDLAESSGRIEVMTWQLLADAIGSLKPVLIGSPGFKMSLNVTPRHLLKAGFAEQLADTLAAAGAATSQIVLEVTEREEFADLDRAAAVVAELQSMGVRVALDDVGVGHSGLSHIQRLRADILKIDKFFVDALGGGGNAEVVIGMIVRLAQELSMTVVAEGIESEAQLAALRSCAVEQGQGYLVSPALAAPRFLDLLQANEQTRAQRAPIGLRQVA